MEQPFDILIKFIHAREEARIHKGLGNDKPWTSDPIVQKYRFCNMDRNDDPVTKFIHKKYLGQEDDFLIVNLTIARWSNQPAALHYLEVYDVWDHLQKDFVETFDALRGAGKPVQNMAYMTWGGHKEFKGRAKHHCFNETTLRDLKASWKDRPEDMQNASLADMADWLIRAKGLQSFLVNQILTDLKYSKWFTTPDAATFLLPGPGTRRGMNRLMERDIDAKVYESVVVREVLQLRDKLVMYVPASLEYSMLDPNNVANILCEFDKYCRVYLNEGKSPKQKYPGV